MTQETELTLEQRILHYVDNLCNRSEHQHSPNGRAELLVEIKERYGEEAEGIAKKLWREGYISRNAYGYIILSSRGSLLMKDGKYSPRFKNKPKVKPSTNQILDYLWETKRSEFEVWLQSHVSSSTKTEAPQ